VHFAAVEHGHAVGDLENAAHVMGDDDGGHAVALLHAQNHLVDDVGADGVEAGVRLVVEDALAAADDGTGDAGALAHAAGECRGVFFQMLGEIDGLQRFQHAAFDFRLVAHAAFDQREGHVFLHGHAVKQRGSLEEHADLLADRGHLALLELVDVHACHEDIATVRADEADDVLHRDRLALAAGADEAERLAMLEGEVDAAEDLLLAEALVDIPQLDEDIGVVARGGAGGGCGHGQTVPMGKT
jgi:hypothetical protein